MMLTASLQRWCCRAAREVTRERFGDERFPVRRRHVPARQQSSRIADLQHVFATGDVAQETAAHRLGGRGDEQHEDNGALIQFANAGSKCGAVTVVRRTVVVARRSRSQGTSTPTCSTARRTPLSGSTARKI